MRIEKLRPQVDSILSIVAADGRIGSLDVSSYLECEAFEALCDSNAFIRVSNGGHFVEWDCGGRR
jgi:hypothetical protein